MIHTIVKDISFNKKGVEIGGPSFGTGNIIYTNSSSMDNIIFSNNTIWSSHTSDVYVVGSKQDGKVILNDAVNIIDVKNNEYDFVFASHSLEHIANPLKAIYEWLRITKNGGHIILILPEKTCCFDHNRNISLFSTLLLQYERNIGENDLSTLPEILKYHDLNMDPAAGNFEQFTKRSLDNFNNRCLHHYVYSPQLLKEICMWFNCEFIYCETEGLNIWFIMKKIN